MNQKGERETETDREGNSALHSAAFLGRSEVVELLLEKGADANAKNNRGQSPMDSVAADWQTTQFIANLLQIEVDRKSTRLNSSHVVISYAVFCLKKKNKKLNF